MARTLIQTLAGGKTLERAWEELNKSNPSSHGISGETIADFRSKLSSQLRSLKKELLDGKFKFSDVRGVLHKKHQSSGNVKKRPIKIAEVGDRIVQKALASLIEKHLSKKYSLKNPASFAYIEDRGINNAFDRVLNLYKKGNPVVLEADIKKFFDSVDRDRVLTEMVFPFLPDESINHLLIQALSSPLGNKDEFSKEDLALFPQGGLPQGGALSPMLANIYLHEFDHELLNAGYGLVRYADDFVVMCKDVDEASNALALSQEILEKRLNLELYPLSDSSRKTQILKITQDKFKFLGIRFNGKRLWPADDSVNRIINKVHDITEFDSDRTILEMLSSLRGVMEGWKAAYSFTDLESALSELNRVLRIRLAVAFKRMGWETGETLTDRQMRFTGLNDLLDL